MTDHSDDKKSGQIKTFKGAAGGWPALTSVTRTLAREGIAAKGMITLMQVNQPTGFDCPGCAWPDKKVTSTFAFCENGAKAVAFEATTKRVLPEFFAEHSVQNLLHQSDHWLEEQGRLTHPMRYNAQSDHYEEITWDAAFSLIAQHLNALPDPNQAAFYTSGRTSNEAAFLYQLFVRSYGTNNFPDCSNMCHEPTSVALAESLGLGKGTVTLDDFEHADAIFLFGQNPGTNHPRMLGTLREAVKRGATVVAINPLKERGLERFTDPQDAVEMLTHGSTTIASHYFQPRVGGDYAVLLGMMKYLVEWNSEQLKKNKPSLFDEAFIAEHTIGFSAVLNEVEHTSWADIHQATGLPPAQLEKLASLYTKAERVIFCWGMGITQHKQGAMNIHMLVNLLLARGNMGREGAGVCPVRGHSNVQGDRTMGINEKPSAKLLDRMDQVFNTKFPRANGLGVVDTIAGMRDGHIRVFFGMGGNFVSATPDTNLTTLAMQQCDLTVHVATKLNRSHLIYGKDALILPCLGRSEIDEQRYGQQAISVEDSMSNVHLSAGTNHPASASLLSEPMIVARMAAATLKNSHIPWLWYVEDYDRIRNVIAEVFDDFYDFNGRVYPAGGFHLDHPVARREWRTKTGKAQFKIKPLAAIYHAVSEHSNNTMLTLTTIRSHDQYNTTIYGMDDRYRGVFGQRRVLFINTLDLKRLNLAEGQWVDIEGIHHDGQKRLAPQFKLVSYNIPEGCVAAYYPETNVLVPLDHHDEDAKTPASKSVPVKLHLAQAPQEVAVG